MRRQLSLFLVCLPLFVACNNPPGPATIALSPSEPLTTDDLEVVFISESADSNSKDTVSYSTFWFVDGVSRPEMEGMSVAAAETAKGEVWKVIVTPTDGELDGPPVASEVVVLNSPPVVEVTVDLEVPLSTEDVVATATATDADGDEVEFIYSWGVDGDENRKVDGATLSASETVKGEIWTVTAVAKDDEADSEPATASVSIENVAPVIDSLELSPAEVYEATTLTATVGATDADSDTVVLSFAWWVDGAEVLVSDANTLTGEHFNKHSAVSVIVTPNDGFADGDSVTSDTLTILNTVPTLTGASLDLTEIREADTVTCVPEGWADDDGDSASYSYTWTVDSVDAGVTSETLDGAYFSSGQSVACTVTPNDGEADGAPATTGSVTVSNTVPVISGVTLSPTSPREGDTLTVTIGTSTDDDGDSVTYSYEWLVNSASTLVGPTFDSLSDLYFAKGDAIEVVVTPNDGTEDGLSVTSGAVTAVNTEPTLASVTLVPDPVASNGSVSALPSGAADADGDTITYAYQWFVDGAALSGTSDSILDGSVYFAAAQQVHAMVTPYDGEGLGFPVQSNVVTVNTPPVVTNVAISPDPAGATDTLACAHDAATDVDGDTVTMSYAWTINGSAATGDATLSDAHARDETVVCTVTPSDALEAGVPVASAALVVTNALPQVDSVSLSPSDVYTDTVVTASVVASDADGDDVSLQYAWSSSAGTDLSAETGSSLDGAGTPGFAKGEVVTVSVTPVETNDATAIGAAATADVTVLNSPPGAPVVSVSPNDPDPDADELVCSVDGTSVDVDGDTVTYSFEWDVDGIPYTGAVDTATTSTVGVADLDAGETWTCVVTPDDGFSSGTSASKSVTVPAACNSLVYSESVYVQIPDAAELDMLYSEYTLEAWVYASDLGFYACPYAGAANTIVSKRLSAGYELSVMNCVSNPPVLRYNENNDASFIDGSDTLSEGVWHHVATSVTGGQAYLWLDGQLQGTGSVSSTGDTTSPLTFGRDSVTTTHGPYPWRGSIRDVRISNTARYLSQFTPDDFSVDADTVGFWAINEGTGSTIYDLSGNGNHGAVVGTPEWQTVCHDEDADGDGHAAWQDCDDTNASLWGEEGSATCLPCVGNDLTDASYPHFGNGTSAPNVANQEYLSADTYCRTGTVDAGWHNSGSSPVPAYAAIELPTPATVVTLRLLVRSDAPQEVYFEASNDSTNGNNGTWTTLSGPISFSGGTGPWWWEEFSFNNTNAYTMYRLVDLSGVGLVVAEWEMLEADLDLDGYSVSTDCNDSDASIHPNAGDTLGDGIDSDCDGLDCQAGWVDGATYYAVCDSNFVTQTEAGQACVQSGYDGVPTVLSGTENQGLHEMVMVLNSQLNTGTANDQVWLDGSDAAVDGTWEWNDGTSYSYSNFHPSQPNGGTSESCMTLSSHLGGQISGQWTDQDCSTSAVSIWLACQTRTN